MKVLASIVVIILLACGGALWFLAGGSLNEFVKSQIETVGHQVTGQQVSVNKVDIVLAKGAGSILGLNLANPKQYTYPDAFSLGEVTLDINLKSVTQSPITIDAIIIKNPKAFAEITSSGESNIKDLIDEIEKNLPSSDQDTNKKTEPSTQTSAEPRINVTKVVLAGTALSLDLSKLGNKEHQLTLPDITLSNIGGKDGLPASELGSVIVKELLAEIWKKTKKEQKKKLKKEVENKLKEKAKKKLSELFNKS